MDTVTMTPHPNADSEDGCVYSYLLDLESIPPRTEFMRLFVSQDGKTMNVYGFVDGDTLVELFATSIWGPSDAERGRVRWTIADHEAHPISRKELQHLWDDPWGMGPHLEVAS